MTNLRTDWPRWTTTAAAGLQSAALLGYAIVIAVMSLVVGIEGPEEVSSPQGTTVEVIAFGLFGIGLGFIAVGRWRQSGWTGAPFFLAQLLALTVGVPLLTAVDSTGLILGIAVTASAVAGLAGLIGSALTKPDIDLTDETRSTRPSNQSTRPGH